MKSFDPVAVLHCGDIGSLQILELLGQWPTHYVCGNVDSRLTGLEAAILQAVGIYHHEFGDITIEDLRIPLLHSHIPQTLDKAIEAGSTMSSVTGIPTKQNIT
ncbi:MAG: metallophosphoesterase family protein [Planctomycetota bacterium]|nr:metallophosphoesterase family protein [Planctomycetota bacterium]